MSAADQAHGFIAGKLPAVVVAYDAVRRECRVHIPGLTDSQGAGISAEIEYPIGDKSASGEFSTDILITAGNPVWVEFEAGDARYPIITGFRNARTGNGTDWRRFHQANIELLASQLIQFLAGGAMLAQAGGAISIQAGGDVVVQAGGNVTIKSSALVSIDAPMTTISGALAVTGAIAGMGGMAVSGGGGAAIDGAMAINGGDLTNNGVSIGATHTHIAPYGGGATTPPA